ncbi:MAG: preprotein translocase subunit SecG [Fuerstiella sp.]
MLTNGFVYYTLLTLLVFTSSVMILLVLIQRGRGGGLAGAFGGMGGQSALGVRAGDVFTKITIVVAVIWVMVAGLLGISMRAIAESEGTGTEIFESNAVDRDDEIAASGAAGDEGAAQVNKADEAEPAEAGEEKSDTDATDADSEKADSEEAAAEPESKAGDVEAPTDSTGSAEQPDADDADAGKE